MKKNASLSLSVNAIVVFVLAFAMLGVGLYVTNLIRESVGGGIMKAVNVESLKSPPTAEEPITIGREVDLKKGKKLKLDIGFYNRQSSTAEKVVIGISDCLDENGQSLLEIGGLPKVVSFVAPQVSPSESQGFMITMEEDKEAPLAAGTYVCTMIAYNEDDPEKIYESKQFFLNVVS